MKKTKKDIVPKRGYNSSLEETYDDVLDRSKYTLDLVNEWISNADTKVSISCGVFSIILIVIVDILVNNFANDSTFDIQFTGWYKISVLISGIIFVISIILHILAIMPNFANVKKRDRKFSLFYNDIKDFENDLQYIQVAKNVSNSEFVDEILREVYLNSKICSLKMYRFKWACICAIASIACLLISSISQYLCFIS